MKMKTVIWLIFKYTLHVIALGVVFVIVAPIISWYLGHRPILGVDFFNTVTLARFFRDHFSILPNGFFFPWWAGSPVMLNVIFFWYWLIGLVAKILPLILAVKYTMAASFFALLLFVYFGCYRLSKNQLLSAFLAICVALSSNLYGSLVWGGSLPYFANQLFFPAVLWSVASYLETNNKRWFWLTVLISGISLLGHLVNAGTFVLLGAALLLLLGYRNKKVTLKSRIIEIVLLGVSSYLFAYRLTRGIITTLVNGLLSGNILNPFGFGDKSAATVQLSGNGIEVSGDSALVQFERSRFATLFTDTTTWLYILFAVAVAVVVIAVLFDRKKIRILSVTAWGLLALYSIVHVYLNSQGISFLSQAWYRAYWHFPITLGFCIAAFFGYAQHAVASRYKTFGWGFFALVSAVVIGLLVTLPLSQETANTLAKLSQRSSPSSSHPEGLNLVRSADEFTNLSKTIAPSWLRPNERNFRLYTSDAQVNVWWNSLFDVPLVRGYLDSVIGSGHSGDQFLLDQAVAGDGLVTNFKYTEAVAKNMALYYIDWFAVKYGEGGHLSKSPNKGVSSYLADSIAEKSETITPGAYILYQTESGQPEIVEDIPQYLNFFRFKDELVTPIASLSNAPTVFCFCSWPLYEGLTKSLSMNNINSQKLITLFSEGNIDDVSLSDLEQFDAIALMGYRYRNKTKAFALLNEYVKKGGKLLIDTGENVAESKAENLPELFPFSQSQRVGLGRVWDLSVEDETLLNGTSKEEFAPLLYDDEEWKFTYARDGLSPNATTLLTQQGKPVLTKESKGSGMVVWSGMNLAYHVQYYLNLAESKLLLSILSQLVSFDQVNPVVSSNTNFIGDRQLKINASSSAKGILFKEQFFKGWHVQVTGKSARIFAAGPTNPGFMYVPLTKANGAVQAKFSYDGQPTSYVIWLLSMGIGLILLDLIIFNGFLTTRRFGGLSKRLKSRVFRWWEKESE